MSESALARALQDEIDREVARLSDLDTPTAAAAAAAARAVAAITADLGQMDEGGEGDGRGVP